MTLTRRMMMLTTGASLLGGCVSNPLDGLTQAGRNFIGPTPSDLQPTPNAAYAQWVAAFKNRAEARGIHPVTLSQAFRGTGYLPGVITRDRNQAEFSRSFEDYLNLVASEPKVTAGRAAYTNQSRLLQRIEARYGVPSDVVAAIWGVESEFGAKRGDIPVVSAASTLAYDGRRGAFFEAQLFAALRILQDGHTTADQLKGSWAGAMGHTQFIPTTFAAHAVDFNGDGKKDIWGVDPTDALASTAAYLAEGGNWQRQFGIGCEVRLPIGYDGPSGRGAPASLATWAARGVIPVTEQSRDLGNAALMLPAGRNGPGFLISPNFGALLRYNASENYALGVIYLAGRLRGEGPIATPFPPDQYGLMIEDRRAIQEGLKRRGYDVGTVDGVFGRQTEAAIRAFETEMGWPVTGQPSQTLLAALR
ncbi:lytic murein transglycosylase [Rhodobacteraceae bacterium XHP0102]|nr:lytic murein transglycosylase [Rhodobacteraceae bacterium XHP0102]